MSYYNYQRHFNFHQSAFSQHISYLIKKIEYISFTASSYSETEIMMVDFFAENGYKFVLALGVVITENLQAQSLCADKKSIEIILRCLKLQNFSSSLSKWCIWILMVR